MQLDMLANNVHGGTQTGNVYVNGVPRQSAAFQRQSCYVLQVWEAAPVSEGVRDPGRLLTHSS